MIKHHVELIGKGDGVNIFLPGTGWSGNFGTPIAESLSERFVTHMIDLPGIGRSEGLDGVVKIQDAANWLDEYIQQKSLEKVNIIGHSLGGIIGLAYAYYYPKKVNRLILLDVGYSKIKRFPVEMMGTVGYVLPIISVLHKLVGQKMLGKGTDSNQSVEVIKSEEQIQKTIVSIGLVDSPFIRTALDNQQSSSIEGISLLLAGYRCNLPKLVKEIKVPCLILYGNREDESKKVQKGINRKVIRLKKIGVTVEELSGGHYAHVTDMRAFTFISSFLS